MKKEQLIFFPKQIDKSKWEILSDNRYISRKGVYDFLQKYKLEMRGTLLDYGAGEMPYKDVFSLADRYIGLDYSVTAESVGFENNGVVYYDGIHIPLDNESVDCVLCIQVLEHVDDVNISLSEIYRVLKGEGIFLITVPHAYPMHMEPFDFRRFTHYGLRNSLVANGFEIVELVGDTPIEDTIRRIKLYTVPFKIRKVVAYWTNLKYFYKRKLGVRGFYGWYRKYIKRDNEYNNDSNLLYPLNYLCLCKKMGKNSKS